MYDEAPAVEARKRYGSTDAAHARRRILKVCRVKQAEALDVCHVGALESRNGKSPAAL